MWLWFCLMGILLSGLCETVHIKTIIRGREGGREGPIQRDIILTVRIFNYCFPLEHYNKYLAGRAQNGQWY